MLNNGIKDSFIYIWFDKFDFRNNSLFLLKYDSKGGIMWFFIGICFWV